MQRVPRQPPRVPTVVPVRSFASAVVILVLSSCGGDQGSTPAPTTTNTTAAVQETTSTTIDLTSVRGEAARRCVGAGEEATESTPGLAEELTPENIDLLVESAVQTFRDRDVGDERTRRAAVESCRAALRKFFDDLSATATTEQPVPLEVGRYSGSADTETDDFTVSGTWRLSWKVSGGAGARVTVRAPDGRFIDSVSIDPGTSESQFRQGCTCYLEISTFGATYEIVVTDLP